MTDMQPVVTAVAWIVVTIVILLMVAFGGLLAFWVRSMSSDEEEVPLERASTKPTDKNSLVYDNLQGRLLDIETTRFGLDMTPKPRKPPPRFSK